MRAHVITVNDSVEHVVVGTHAEASFKMGVLMETHWTRRAWNDRGKEAHVVGGVSVRYEDVYCWRIISVNLTVSPHLRLVEPEPKDDCFPGETLTELLHRLSEGQG